MPRPGNHHRPQRQSNEAATSAQIHDQLVAPLANLSLDDGPVALRDTVFATILARAAHLARSAPHEELYQRAIHGAVNHTEANSLLAAANIQIAVLNYSEEPFSPEHTTAFQAAVEADYANYSSLLEAAFPTPTADQGRAIEQAPGTGQVSASATGQVPAPALALPVDEIDPVAIQQILDKMQAREDMKNENERMKSEIEGLEKQVEELQMRNALLEAQVKRE